MQDGAQVLVASAAVEDTVPEVIRARELGCARMSRAQLLSTLFNAAPARIAIGGTSGKSTVTGMAGWIMTQVGRDPTIMNGAVMKISSPPTPPLPARGLVRAACSCPRWMKATARSRSIIPRWRC
jgi:UDP-N-acetylmuramate--alanine ligase